MRPDSKEKALEHAQQELNSFICNNVIHVPQNPKGDHAFD